MAVVRDSRYGTFSFGPAVDGNFVPAVPAVSFQDGNYDSNVTIMIGHNPEEGVLFTPANATDVTTFEDSVLVLYPSMTQENLDHVTETLYPAIFDGTYGYTDPYGRASNMRADAIIVCKKLPLLNAFPQKAYSYQFSLPPGIHGADLEYTFYKDEGQRPFDPATLSGVASEQSAHTHQRWIGDFVTNGQPKNINSVSSLLYPGHQSNASTVNLDLNGTSVIREYAAGPRCAFWVSLEL